MNLTRSLLGVAATAVVAAYLARRKRSLNATDHAVVSSTDILLPQGVPPSSTPLVETSSCRMRLFSRGCGGPCLCEFPRFATPEECAALLVFIKSRGVKTARQFYSPTTREYFAHEGLTSSYYELETGQPRLLHELGNRVRFLLGFPPGVHHRWKIVQCLPGQETGDHHDRPEDRPDLPLITCILYLNSLNGNTKGGNTVFPGVGGKIEPEAGKLLLFTTSHPRNGELSLHSGERLEGQGEKWIATLFLSVEQCNKPGGLCVCYTKRCETPPTVRSVRYS